MKKAIKIVSVTLIISIMLALGGCYSSRSEKKKHHKDREETVVFSKSLEESESDYSFDDFDETVETSPEVELPFDEAFEEAKSIALDFISFAHYSRIGLFNQLTSPYTYHYPEDVVTAALDSIEEEGLVDWNQEAFELVTNLIDSYYYSRQGLFNEITYCSNGTGFAFTMEEATNAINRLESEGLVDWNSEAVEAVNTYLQYSGREFTREEMIEQLTFTGDMGDCFTMEQAIYAVDEVGL